MAKRTAHWRDIRSSDHLQKVERILKDADRPMTGLELQDEAMRRGFRIVNPGTDCWEIGQNEGYSMSGGVRFPDGKYRYWLIAAPGWTARWLVTKDYQVRSAELQEVRNNVEDQVQGDGTRMNADERGSEQEEERKTCPRCGIETGGGFCSDEHKREFFDRMKGA